MSQLIVFACLGLTAGAVYAALSLGLVITYKGTGIINFAAGAMAAWGTYVFAEAQATGALVLPLPFAVRIDLGAESVPLAIGLGLLSAAGLGLLVHLLVFRPLRQAPPLAKVVASVGVMVTIDALVLLRFGTTARVIPSILPNGPVNVGGSDVTSDRLLLGAAAILLGAVVWAFFRYARAGLALRAGAEDERAAALAGYSPNALAAGAWIASTTVATLLCILAVPVMGLVPQVLTLMIVPALACALVGRFDAVGPTVAAAIGLGVLQSELVYLSSQSWWPSWAVNGLGDALPFVVLIVVLFVVGRRLPTRGAVQAERLPAMIIPRFRPPVIAASLVLGVLAVVLTSGGYRYGVITSMIIAIAALSFVVVTGMVGQISLAQAAIAGSAGFLLSELAETQGIPFPWSPLLAVAGATLLGVLVGIPALRIRGAQLAVVTLAGAVAVQRFIFENPSITDPGGNPIPDPSFLGVNLAVSSGSDVARVGFGLFVLVVLAVAAIVVTNLMRSATGRRFLAVRENERAAAAAGVNVATSKLLAFAIASALAGVSGCLLGYSRQQLSAESFDVFVSLSWLAFAYLGGITSVSGAMIAGTFAPLGIGYVILDRWFSIGSNYTLIAGILLVATAVWNPVGIAGATREATAAIAARLRRRRSEPVDHDLEREASATSSTDSAGPLSPRAEPPLREGTALLEVKGVSVSYGGVRAVDGASLRVHGGEIVGLIGPNGAGKTSLIDALTGFTPAGGTIELAGEEIAGLPAHERARRGLRRTWQAVEPFADLTLRQNLQVAAEEGTARSALLDLLHPARPAGPDGVDWALEQLELRDLADRKPGELSLGHQKLLGVARALAARPRVLLLDEPAAGLSNLESAEFGRHLEQLANSGTAALLIDHDMSLVLGICDYVYVIEFGIVIAAGTAAEIRSDPKVMKAYLGEGSGSTSTADSTSTSARKMATYGEPA